MFVRHAMTLDLSAEAVKAWSQHLGHADVLTPFTSYGHVPPHRQGELIRAQGQPRSQQDTLSDPNVIALIAAIRGTGQGRLPDTGSDRQARRKRTKASQARPVADPVRRSMSATTTAKTRMYRAGWSALTLRYDDLDGAVRQSDPDSELALKSVDLIAESRFTMF